MKIDLTESEYRTILEMAKLAAGTVAKVNASRFTRLRDNLRVRWERAADDEQQKEAGK